MLRIRTLERLEEEITGKEKGRNGKADHAAGQLPSVTCIVLGNMRLRARKPVAGLAGRIRVAVSPGAAMRAGSRFDLFSLSSSYTLSPQAYVLGSLVTAPARRLRTGHAHGA
jgi:hypothetical protein